MKNFSTLLKMISRNNDMEMPEHGEKAKGYKVMGYIAMGCIMIPCCVVVGFIVYIMTAALMEAGGQTEGLNLVIQLMSVFGVIFSIMVIFNLLYFSSDLDHLLPLPVRPAELVAAKFTHAYFAESVMEFMVLFCGFIGYFVAAEIRPVSVITSIIGVFLLPVLPLVYCGIFSLIVMAFLSKAKLLKNVDFMVGLAMVVFAGLFIWSFAQMDSVNIRWPILVVALIKIPATADSIRGFRATFEKGFFLSDVLVLIAVTAIAFFATAMNSIASTAFTREGSHISFIKHIPMAYRTQIRVKVWISLVFSGVTVAISTVILGIYMDCSFIDSVYYVIIGILCVAICTYTGILLDSTHPKIDWEDEYGALRGNLNAFFNMAIAIAAAIVFCGAGYLLFRFTRIPSIAVYILYLMILGAMLIILRIYTMKVSERNIDTDVYSE